MHRLPDDTELVRTTPTFTSDTVPAGLLRAHSTKAGTWGRIVVTEGRLLYRILDPDGEEVELSPGVDGIVEPGRLHEVEPLGHVSFHVEFRRVAGAG